MSANITTFSKNMKASFREALVNRLKSIYVDFWTYIKENRKFCILVILIIAELVLYSVLNATPDDSFGKYVASLL